MQQKAIQVDGEVPVDKMLAAPNSPQKANGRSCSSQQCNNHRRLDFRQLSTLNYVKLTTGLEPTNFLLTKLRLTLCY